MFTRAQTKILGLAASLTALAPTAAKAATTDICPGTTQLVNGICQPTSSGQGIFSDTSTPLGLVFTILTWAIALAGLVAVIYIVWGGYKYITGGSEDQKEGGRKYITNAVIGLIIVLVAYFIVRIVANTVKTGSLG